MKFAPGAQTVRGWKIFSAYLWRPDLLKLSFVIVIMCAVALLLLSISHNTSFNRMHAQYCLFKYYGRVFSSVNLLAQILLIALSYEASVAVPLSCFRIKPPLASLKQFNWPKTGAVHLS